MTELFSGAWTKPETQHRSPNVIKMIEIFNRVANQVAACIVSELDFKRRVKILSKFIQIGWVNLLGVFLSNQSIFVGFERITKFPSSSSSGFWNQ